MSGPYPPYQGAPPPQPYAEPYPLQPFPPYQGPPAGAHPGPPSGAYPGPPSGTYQPAGYPGPLPPPVPYPKRRRGRAIVIALATVTGIAAVAAAVVLGVRHDTTPTTPLTAATAKTAIQNYLDALTKDDTEAISRNVLCGLYDGVRDRRSDDMLAGLSSDAFQKQFSKAKVTSIDTMVFASSNAAQVLFTMRVTPATGSRSESDQQGVAQLLVHDNQVLVCSYVLRTAGTF